MTIWNREHPDSNSGPGWRRRHPEKARAYVRKQGLKQNGVTVEQYAELWAKQEGQCANPRCSSSAALVLPDHRLGLQVDHDHISGRIRGLLCPGCNLALGCVQDDIERLTGLVEYLT